MILDRRYEYNGEPVFYCRRCGSLAVIAVKGGRDVCGKCGSVDVGKAEDIYEWEDLVEDMSEQEEERERKREKKKKEDNEIL